MNASGGPSPAKITGARLQSCFSAGLGNEVTVTFKSGTVLVVGAGASKEVNMPVGDELAIRIHGLAHLNWRTTPESQLPLVRALHQRFGDSSMDATMAKLKDIAEGVITARSIDAYLDRMRSDAVTVSIGKLLIAWFILEAERNSKLKIEVPGGRVDLVSLRDTWYSELSGTLFDGVVAEDLDTIADQITIICFNYDRCIERYMQEAISIGYRIAPERAAEVVRRFRILRPYGGLGQLPDLTNNNNSLPFGARPEASALWEIADRIRTFTERHEDGDPVIAGIREAMATATQVVFLGFGFQLLNLELLRVPPRPSASSNVVGVYATGKGVPREQEQTIINELRMTTGLFKMQERQIHLAIGATCRDLFTLHGRNLVEGMRELRQRPGGGG